MNPFEVPVIEVFGPQEMAGFFQNLYAVLYPAMPFIMLAIAIALAGTMIGVIRKIFSFSNLRGDREDYNYKDDE